MPRLDEVWKAWTTSEGIKTFSPPRRAASAPASLVRLNPAGEGRTEVRLTHTGWGDVGQWDQAYAYFERAWGNVLANLEKRFVSGPVDWTEWLRQLRAYQNAEDAKAAGARKP